MSRYPVKIKGLLLYNSSTSLILSNLTSLFNQCIKDLAMIFEFFPLIHNFFANLKVLKSLDKYACTSISYMVRCLKVIFSAFFYFFALKNSEAIEIVPKIKSISKKYFFLLGKLIPHFNIDTLLLEYHCLWSNDKIEF